MKHSIESESCMADGENAYVHCPACDEDYQGEHSCTAQSTSPDQPNLEPPPP
jgi:hypothetical protein